MLVDRDEREADVTASSLRRPVAGRGRGVALVALAVLVGGVGVLLMTGSLGMGRGRASGPTIAPEVPVTALDVKRKPSNNSPVITSDPTDPRVMVIANRLDAPGFGCALQVSADGGRTWATAAPVPALPVGADTCYGPEVAFDSGGVLQYLFIGLHGRGNEPMGAFLTTSSDQGHTFSVPRQVLGPLNFGVRMAINPTVGRLGRMHLAWVHAASDPPLGGFVAEPNPVMAAYSDDGGVTFSTPVQVSDPARDRVVGPVLTLGPDSAVHVGYYDLGDDARDYQGLEGPVWEGTWSVVVATSVDGGRQFGPGVVVDDRIVPPERPILIFTMPPPALVADEHRMCAAWTDGRNGDADVLLRCSTDGGVSWAEARRVNDDPVSNGALQYLPRLGLAPGGRLDAVFLDRRFSPKNDKIDVSYTSSTDGGRTFSANRRVTRESSSARIGAQYEGPAAKGKVEIGGRLGLLSRRSGAMLSWPDSRNAGERGTAQDLYASEVSYATSHQPLWARGLGAVLLGGGVLALAVAAYRRRPDTSVVGNDTPPEAEDEASRTVGRRRPAWVLPVVLVGVVGLVAAVKVVGAGEGSAAFAGPQVVHVTMTENRFDYRPPARAGRVVFQVDNAGKEIHSLAIYLLPDDMPPIDVQLRGTQRRSVDPFAEPALRQPGESQSFAVDLVPGQRYAFLCSLTSKQGKKYAELGMSSEFRPGP